MRVAFDSQAQRRIFGKFATGVTVVTARVGEQLYGMTANAITSLSLEPPLVMVAVDKRADFYKGINAADSFAMSILSDAQEGLSRRFAARGPKEFGDLVLSTAVTGAPILAEALGYVDCRKVSVLPGGDHDIFVGEIVAGDARDGRPLLFYEGKYRRLAD